MPPVADAAKWFGITPEAVDEARRQRSEVGECGAAAEGGGSVIRPQSLGPGNCKPCQPAKSTEGAILHDVLAWLELLAAPFTAGYQPCTGGLVEEN